MKRNFIVAFVFVLVATMVMSACTLSSKAQGNSTITDVEAVAKSYKDYFIDLKTLNGVFYE